MIIRKRTLLAFSLAALGLLHGPSQASAQPLDEADLIDRGLITQTTQSNSEQPRRHERERQPSRLSGEEAQDLYGSLRREELALLGAADTAGAGSFLEWQRYNSVPYLSQAHGNTYVNNYVNETGRAYGRYEDAGILPVGTIIAKDSFVVHSDGSYELGQLVVMEKMPSGFNRVSGDWRYTVISPDGAVLGSTRGANAEQVEYCVPCHLARERTDHLFFLPEAFRVTME